VSRALVVKLFPREQIGEIFGLVNLASYLSAIIGPLYWGLILLYLSKFGQWGYRLACLSLILFVATGIFFLLRIPKETGNSR
ncbi:MAG: MFS transporter, partial [Candidatus Aureabacteria bacterium]|nr:MFS transporter [Candidatus Auribacterota bacterium]